ncbi:MAG: hypothetical protein AAF203_11430, partial [Pseudomonadota bacterium]
QKIQKELTDKTTEVDHCEQKILDLSKDNKDLSYQLEALQKLWVETQEKLEKETSRTKSLERINRELAKQGHDEKIEKSIKISQVDSPPEQAIKERLNQVYAQQYTPIKPMDV